MHWFVECDNCGKPDVKTRIGDFADLLTSFRQDDWLIRRKKRDDQSYKIGDNNYYYYCPECKKKMKYKRKGIL